MDCDRIIELLQSVAILAVNAQRAIENGDSNKCWEDIDLIEGDLSSVKKQLEQLNR